ncbi:Glyoxalase-like domain protein [Pseudoalteromonas sp. P1-13-1a]|uniref:VOC family protein n=1 Tax=unclassified Pseudoalteromonas TaxID=194690 RepID=UPI0006D65FF8|nr:MULTISPECIES: VOC family protein [unclassified Pseudoalteromonas]KPZ56480.1 Glyoxalase-like domain protein [Pseudoalteromonas sp. P1-13-1a]KPZ61281.1 Glyoxalase-like domain protein [Pseudoalteromonas sp. P1-7a]
MLGAFSISLTVKDIGASKAFYEKLGFSEFAGEIEQNWLVMKNGEHLIGLFSGMFDKNMLTFNPGWDQHAQTVTNFKDVDALSEYFQSANISVESVGDKSFIITDPDGNPILIDQHV